VQAKYEKVYENSKKEKAMQKQDWAKFTHHQHSNTPRAHKNNETFKQSVTRTNNY